MRQSTVVRRCQQWRPALLRSRPQPIQRLGSVRRLLWLGVLVILIASVLPACGFLPGTWRELSALIQDDNGLPVAGASVRGLLYDERVVKAAAWKNIVDNTDSDGRVEIDILNNAYIDVSVTKDGYYPTLHRIIPLAHSGKRETDVERIRLRKKVNPVAMYARRVIFLVKEHESVGSYGYDFFRGDFVAPYGEGVTTDLELSYLYEFENNQNYHWSLSFRFVNPGDGLIPQLFDPRGSDFLSDYEAPADGYRVDWTISRSRGGTPSGQPKIQSDPNHQGFYFRIRSELDDAGKVVGGYYGKIYGVFPEAAYYLNPYRGDRNVEFDVSQNLFGSLPILQRTSSP